MAYVKNTWVDQDVERPKTYQVTNNQDGSITLTDDFGLVTELGTPVNAVNMNHIEDGLALSDLMKYDATVTYNEGEWVTGVVDNKKGIYTSLANNNTGNPLTDDTKWEEVKLGGGSSRNIGEIVPSTLPLVDAGLHLLDGTLLPYGSYKDFIDYIADIYDSGDYSDLFETEADWQTSVTTYGVCGKFVYDSVNNTVRLPKYNSRIYTGGGEAPVVGNNQDVYAHTITNTTDGKVWSGGRNVEGRNWNGGFVQIANQSNSNNSQHSLRFTTDATKSGLIADLSNITTSLEGYYYIVIATSTKTDIQVDIDEIATDLNGKADVDLSNVNQTGKNNIMAWGIPDWADRQAGVTALNVWKTVSIDCWVSVMTLTTNVNRTLWLKIKDENGNELNGCVDNNGFMRAQQYSSGTGNQVFAVIPKNYSYCAIIDSDQSFYASYEYPLKGAN